MNSSGTAVIRPNAVQFMATEMLADNRLPRLTVLFLGTTVLTSATGFFFPSEHLMPSHVIGGISLVALAVALLALYGNGLSGIWRWIYVVCAIFALALNSFVGIVQAFQKVAFLHSLAPTQSEAPFLIAQLALVAACLVLGFLAIKRFHPGMGASA